VIARLTLIALLLSSLAVFACADGEGTVDPRTPGTLAMASRLAALAVPPDDVDGIGPGAGRAQAFAVAFQPNLVPQLRAQIAANDDPFQDLILRHRLAVQLMREGDTDASLTELETLLGELESFPVPLPPERKARMLAILMRTIGVTALRLGEQENCIAAHSAESCLFPIRGAGVHRHERGSRRAIEALTRQLEIEPTSIDARWLINLAYMTLGEYPDSVPPAYRLAPELFASEYDLGRFREAAMPAGVDVSGSAGGSVIEDFDGDGRLDIVATSWRLDDQVRYFRSAGDGTFVDRTIEAGLAGETGGINAIHADYDNDGLPDLLILRGGWQGEAGLVPNSLLRNLGGGTFDDVTEQAGLLAFHGTHSAAWADYDNDGLLDLFVANEEWYEGRSHPSQLFRNRGDGTFEECSTVAGFGPLGPVKAVAWGDYDNDGWEDLYVSIFGRPNRLYRNVATDPAVAPGGRAFVDVTAAAGVAGPAFSFPTWFFDYDNDGDLDLFVAAWDGLPIAAVAAYAMGVGAGAEVPRLYRNNGDGTFDDVAAAVGLDRTLLVMGANYGDLDNDGRLDVYLGTGAPELDTLMPNRMFRNAADGTFQDVTSSGGFGHLQKGHGVSFGDLDNDGDQDVYTVMGGWYLTDVYMNALFENPGNDNRWITVRLRGTHSNRFGVGARLRLVVQTPAGPREIHTTVSTGGSFGSSSLQQEIGLGDATAIDLLEVRWPASGETQQFRDVAPDQVVLVTEGEVTLESVSSESFRLAEAHHGGEHGPVVP
jgi:hypothetical protein